MIVLAPPISRSVLRLVASVALVAASGMGRAEAQGMPARQITVFGVMATPGGGPSDPKLAPVLPQLRRLLPDHGFKLIKIESQRATAGEIVTCELGDGFAASSQLVTAMDPNGKVQMRFDLSYEGVPMFQTIVTTPPDQAMFCEKPLPNGSRLLIGLGAR